MRRALFSAIGFWLLFGAIGPPVDAATAPRLPTDRFPLGWALKLLASGLLGTALGVQFALWQTLQSRSGLLKPTAGRSLVTLLLSCLSPATQFGGLPVPAGLA